MLWQLIEEGNKGLGEVEAQRSDFKPFFQLIYFHQFLSIGPDVQFYLVRSGPFP